MYVPSGRSGSSLGEALGRWAKESIWGALSIAGLGIACIAYGVTYAFTGGTSPFLMNWIPAFGGVFVLAAAWFVLQFHASRFRRLLGRSPSE
jgi:predicted PurR-regulated permease PerM